MVRDPGRELDDRIQELAQDAMSEYVQDPLGSSIRSLEDYQQEFETLQDDDFHRGFAAGHRQAIHNLKSMYISYSGHFSCDCRYPFPEEHSNGAWACVGCGETLVEEGEEVVEREILTED